MQKIVYHVHVKQEVIFSAQYYESQSGGLGVRFLEEFDRAVAEISDFPLAWPILEGEYRRHQLANFPFGVIYRVVGSQLRILALMNLHKKPGYWQEKDKKF